MQNFLRNYQILQSLWRVWPRGRRHQCSCKANCRAQPACARWGSAA